MNTHTQNNMNAKITDDNDNVNAENDTDEEMKILKEQLKTLEEIHAGDMKSLKMMTEKWAFEQLALSNPLSRKQLFSLFVALGYFRQPEKIASFEMQTREVKDFE